MKVYLVKDPDPCYDCCSEEVIAIYDNQELAIKAVLILKASGFNRAMVEMVEMNTVITSGYLSTARARLDSLSDETNP